MPHLQTHTMYSRTEIINSLSGLGKALSTDEISPYVSKACAENPWFSSENYTDMLLYWSTQLTVDKLSQFSSNYSFADSPQKVGIIMAGNIPLVGFHDLLCVLLSGHKALVKMSSDDSVVMKKIIEILKETLADNVEIVERVKNVDAVVATGSNNSFRYFEYYFKDIPNLLRKSRKSIAVLTGNETQEELSELGKDVFHHYGLGCRNVSLILLPQSMKFSLVLDQWQGYYEVINHHKYANNYTYHKALFLMNQQKHLDANFVLAKEDLDLHAPLGCINYFHYQDEAEVASFLNSDKENIQCIVGNYLTPGTVPFGQSQYPDLEDFADNIDTLSFLCALS